MWMWRLLNRWCDICTIHFKKKLMNACAFECSGISFYPKEGLKVALVPPQIDVPRNLTVKSFASNKIKFFEVSDKSNLKQFDGMHLLVEEDVAHTLEKPEEEEFVGWMISDKTSLKSFTIKEVVDMPTQKLAICGDEDETQIVLHDDLIESVDEKNKHICVVLPENYFEEF